ncbi:glutaredoxin family protein [Jeongeupia naejangsanensis]|uniref:Glutaredoxin family protein n=1 Tax=Jeongeupia naejangsanensis TaxID=613195 RepID=A0ABS2BIU3_9NEIS|nr:glutaredoxin family protein [Jeongeupia naejangsanensis]MBM3115514.1 glutaredoxin family protein [Jeongeupia naejangsanensis]
MKPVLKLFGREYCGLCLTMRDQLQPLAEQHGFAVEWIDIDDNDALEALYGELVPVLTNEDGVEICHYHLDVQALDDWRAKIR